MTKTVTVHDAQTQLLNLLSFAMKGNEVIITKDHYCPDVAKNNWI